jgi:hypothetical protein
LNNAVNSPWSSAHAIIAAEPLQLIDETEFDELFEHEFGGVKPEPSILTFDWSIEDLYDRYY